MSDHAKIIVAGGIAVVAYDLLASLASRGFGFPYARASIGSYLLYLAIGFVAARSASTAPIQNAAIAAGVAGLVDASVGWAVSWALGPARLPSGITLTIGRWMSAALFVIVLAAAVGAIGGVAGRRRPAPNAAAV